MGRVCPLFSRLFSRLRFTCLYSSMYLYLVSAVESAVNLRAPLCVVGVTVRGCQGTQFLEESAVRGSRALALLSRFRRYTHFQHFQLA